MSDFFANLAARSFGSMAPIRPRVVSLFEPARAGLPSLRVPDRIMNFTEEPPFAATESESTPPPESSHPEPAPARNIRRTQAPPVEAMSDHFRTEEPTPSQRISDLRPAPPRTDAPPSSSAVQVRAVRALEPAEQSLEQNLPAVKPDFELPEISVAVAPPVQRVTVGQESEPATSRAFVWALPPAAGERILEPFSGRRAHHDRAPIRVAPPATATDPEPVIQVSIGRVEVRAATASAPARREPAVSPVMSLGEYLSRQARRGGA
jgi:hypothetical protein